MHVSLDGFVAGPNGEMDWIHVDDEIFDYVGDRINHVNTALYGRVTYQMMEAYWPTAADQPNASKHDIEHSAWYKNVEKVVISRTLAVQHPENTKIISNNVPEQIKALKQKPGREVVMFGSPGAAHSLMDADLIDALWLFVNPVIQGEGIALFRNIHHAIKLKLQQSKVFSSGVVCLHYERVEEK